MIFVNVDSTSQYYGINFNGSRVADITDFGDTDKAVVQVCSLARSRKSDLPLGGGGGSVMLKIGDFQEFQAKIHHCWG